MTRFRDEYLPTQLLRFGAATKIRYSTRITQVDSGAEQANRNWLEPLRTFTIPEIIKGEDDYSRIEDLKDHFLVMAGPYHTWAFRDPNDAASARMLAAGVLPITAGTDQQIGVGDGARTTFPLIKTYVRGAYSTTRRIHLPLVNSVVVTLDNVDPMASSPPTNTYTVSRPGGVVTFSDPPGVGDVVRWGGYYDCEVRFEADDSFEQIIANLRAGKVADLTLVELRTC